MHGSSDSPAAHNPYITGDLDGGIITILAGLWSKRYSMKSKPRVSGQVLGWEGDLKRRQVHLAGHES